MKNKISLTVLVVLGVILCSIMVSAVDISVENYYPKPAEAGDYFTAWLTISNRGQNTAEKVSVRLKPSYPFSLDPGEPNEITIDEIKAYSSITKSFNIRVDQQAKEGDNQLMFAYKNCAGCSDEEKSTTVKVIGYQTLFDTVIQEISAEGVFFAIANIGKNPANAVTVSIPDQPDFKTDVISSSIVGNLETGDYTIIGFKIYPQQMGVKEKKDLSVNIDYTDPFGTRRTVTKNVSISPSSLGASMGQMDAGMPNMGGFNRNKGSTFSLSGFLSDTWFWVAAALTAVVIFLLVKRTRK